jgi:SAM-dependent methyltransferase
MCRDDHWVRGRTYRYARREADRSPRQRVLFEVWFPDDDQVALALTWCRTCGFVCYTPRPDAVDIERKYASVHASIPAGSATQAGLGAHPEPGEPVVSFSQLRAHDSYRAERTHRQLTSHLGAPGRLLDVGGGHGQLLGPFIAAGWSCAVVDYNEDVLPGIERLGSTLDDVGDDMVFEGAICSHVLEHLADPVALLEQIRRHLVPGGALIAEVPHEVWRGIPIDRDPVTHINFFTSSSFASLFTMNGWEILEQHQRRYPGERQVVGVVVARPSETAPRLSGQGARETATLLDPGRVARLRHAVRKRGGSRATATGAVRRLLRPLRG